MSNSLFILRIGLILRMNRSVDANFTPAQFDGDESEDEPKSPFSQETARLTIHFETFLVHIDFQVIYTSFQYGIATIIW